MNEASTLVDARLLRSVCGHFTTGVTVVTGGTTSFVVGVTVNSFTSVSLDPPLILVCIQKESSELPALRRAGAFAVNILAADQEEVCRIFASRHTRRANAVDVHAGITGVPILSKALAYLECRLHREVDGGDHAILIGEVVALDVLRDDRPLAFFRSAFHHLPNGS
ncbi:flavin reductase family protein [Dactylosporangium roseum]|uniref:Flavin reductase family protein n=1 Tax=Dactylosporangium roseum TaxID=47989 RepID=A0ABY5YX84_9ACTN|nr:flavin reductase family protein [Dactylosporangium roseum]UWZ34358.1 flavin reductase family protein [Dactylosporangium roseum]